MSKTWDELVEHDADGLVVQCWGAWQPDGVHAGWLYRCVACGQLQIVIRGDKNSLPSSHNRFFCPHEDVRGTICHDCGNRVTHVAS